MPNDADGPADAKPQPETLEDLFQEAEEQAKTPVVDQLPPCQHVNSKYNVASDPDVHKCPTCLWDFCPDCASILDPRYCRLCVSEAAVELIQEPLVDTEGHVLEHARKLTPAPTATFFKPRLGTLARKLSEMSDPELEDFVKQYIELVKQAELVLDTRRVVLGSAKMESAQRDDIKRRRLRADKRKWPVKTTSVGKPVTQAVKMDMLRMIEALRLLKVKKDAEAAAKAVDKKMKEPRL
jgi:hypothetical protein